MSNFLSAKHCRICHRPNETLHWHEGDDGGPPWVYCVGKCQRAYSLYEYTAKSGLSMAEFLNNPPDFKEAPKNEVQKMAWPHNFISLMDSRAKPGIDYLKSRAIDIENLEVYYDIHREGIVFPYHYDSAFVGAQIRFIKPIVDSNGDTRKIDTIPGTRLGYLFYGWNQRPLISYKKAVVVTEGAFNAISIMQGINVNNDFANPWLCISTSGSGFSQHKIDVLTSLKDNGIKVILASDSDEAGIKMWERAIKSGCITHYAFTGDSNLDWNQVKQTMSREEFGHYFLNKVVKV